MLDIPAEIVTLLKSKSMKGTNRPLGTVTINNVPIPDVTSISINRSKGSASQATVVLNNKLGKYAPDPAGPYNQLCWPNKTIKITLGYGSERPQVFSGFIDSAKMHSFPATMTIVARDASKLALDQNVQRSLSEWEETVYEVLYQWQTIEYIFNDLATICGYPTILITPSDASATVIPAITFSSSYANAFQQLAELCKYEWFCDEVGALIFRPAKEPAPESMYTFIQGIDMFSLDYEISDAELYSKVVVMGKDVLGRDLLAEASCYEEVFGIPSQKVMHINANDRVSTYADLLAMAISEAAFIDTKSRQVTFVTTGIPYIQIGDCISPVESSTSISEVYRVFEVDHNLIPDGTPLFATTIRCYHYAAAAA